MMEQIFDDLGKTYITDEAHLEAGTVLASCGIAYAMRYIRAAAEGGVELGFSADVAKDIVLQTVKGAVAASAGKRQSSRSGNRQGDNCGRNDHQRIERDGACGVHFSSNPRIKGRL